MHGPRDYHTKSSKSERERQIPYDITYMWNLKYDTGTSLVVQWLRLHAPNAGSLGSISGQGTRSHMLQLRVRMPQLGPGTAK